MLNHMQSALLGLAVGVLIAIIAIEHDVARLCENNQPVRIGDTHLVCKKGNP